MVARRRSSRLYQELIEGEVASQLAWDHEADAGVRLISIRYLSPTAADSSSLHVSPSSSSASSPCFHVEKASAVRSSWPVASKRGFPGSSSAGDSESKPKRVTYCENSFLTMENGTVKEVQQEPPIYSTPRKADATPCQVMGDQINCAGTYLDHSLSRI